MNREEFKKKYFTDNFYWVNETNYKQLQEIGIEMDCVNPSGKKSIIEMHNGFNNLGFRTNLDTCITKFQKECFLVEGKEAANYTLMIHNYNTLNP